MPDLIAQGTAPEHRWRRPLPEDQACTLGRETGVWSVPWDPRISRRHAELVWRRGRLHVRRLPHARNPLFVRGHAADNFVLRTGEHFVIGETAFTLADQRAEVSLHLPLPVTEQTFSADYLKELKFRHADQRIELLGRIPEIIAAARSDQELGVRLVSILLGGIAQAAAVALVCVEGGQPGSPIRVLHWDRRLLTGEDFQPGESLIRRAVERGESVVHIWSDGSQPEAPTVPVQGDWAFCTPLAGAACRGWAFYVAGYFQPPDKAGTQAIADLRDDLKFTEVLGSTLSSLRQAQLLERSQAGLRSFFSPLVLEALANQPPETVLAPRQTEVSVLFCDLRGFTRHSEQAADDLFGLLRRVSQALGVMTRQILRTGGVVGDFHGDAAMGFWGWPLPQEDAIARACQAALAIRAEFTAAARDPHDPLADFRIGIGLASGPAVAGRIGTVDQVKVTVFGPVVNRAARLESLTKRLHAPILLDQTTAAGVRASVPTQRARVRRLAILRLDNLENPLEVSELLPPESEYPQLTDAAIQAYESALDALQSGQWQEALQWLHRVPAEDQAKDFLTVFIAQHNRTPPSGWDGQIPLASK